MRRRPNIRFGLHLAESPSGPPSLDPRLMFGRLLILALSVMPKHAMSRAAGAIANVRIPRALRGTVYRGYSRVFGARPQDAELPLEAYESINAFFTRQLKPGLRAVSRDGVISPVDGAVGRVREVRLRYVPETASLETPVTLDTGLDPVCALAVTLRLAPNGKAQLTFATAASGTGGRRRWPRRPGASWMRAGRLLQLATPEELADRPADPYVEALLEMRRV